MTRKNLIPLPIRIHVAINIGFGKSLHTTFVLYMYMYTVDLFSDWFSFCKYLHRQMCPSPYNLILISANSVNSTLLQLYLGFLLNLHVGLRLPVLPVLTMMHFMLYTHWTALQHRRQLWGLLRWGIVGR